jgi:transglutaminase-like putative cysteine protease
MRLSIEHATIYRYPADVSHSVQHLRLTPFDDMHQRILDWRLNLPAEAFANRDAYGNQTHFLALDFLHSEICISVSGIVETNPEYLIPANGISPLIFLRTSPLTRSNEAIRNFAEPFQNKIAIDRLKGLDELAASLHSHLKFDQSATHVHTTAAEAFTLGRGVCQDYSHIYITCCRSLGVPARYVSGYLYSGPESTPQIASHAWVEAWIEDTGWIGFDVTNRKRADDSHLRLAVGMDYLDACPIRGVRRGGGTEEMSVSVDIRLIDQ